MVPSSGGARNPNLVLTIGYSVVSQKLSTKANALMASALIR